MKYTEVKSSNIAGVGLYEGDLYVKFKAGTEYKYYNVPTEKYNELLEAESIGKFLNVEIKGKFLYEMVPPAP